MSFAEVDRLEEEYQRSERERRNITPDPISISISNFLLTNNDDNSPDVIFTGVDLHEIMTKAKQVEGRVPDVYFVVVCLGEGESGYVAFLRDDRMVLTVQYQVTG